MTDPHGSGAGRAEQTFLLLGARRQLAPPESAEFRRLAGEALDWRAVLQLADRHQVLALLYGSLKREGCLDRWPPAAQEALHGAVRRRAARSLALTDELIRILEVFRQRAIPAIPCKGPAVGMAAYGTIALRSFCDLDILVPESHLHLAHEALAGFGYRPTLRLNAKQERAFLNNECALQYRDEARGNVVELHWRFCERNASVDLPVAAFWHRAGRIALGGAQVPTLATEDLLLYLSVHGAKHRWERLEWIACLAEIIRGNPQLDWTAVFQRAESLGTVRLLNVALYLAQSLLGALLPAQVAEAVEGDAAARRLGEAVKEEAFAPVASEPHYQRRATRYLFMMRTRERWRDRARILIYSAIRSPHPDANEWIQLPPRLAFLHRIFRPVRLFAEYSLVAWRHYLR